MDLTYKQEVGVGGLVLAGLVVFVVGMFWLTGRSLSSKGITAHVVFENVAGLKEGDPVMVSGVRKGRVALVTLDRVGHVTVTLELTPDVRPKTDASATVDAGDFFGGRFIAYYPGSDNAPFLPSNGTIQGSREEQLTDVAAGVATKANALLTNATALVNEQLATDIHNTLLATQAVYVLPLGEVQRAVARVGVANPYAPTSDEVTKLGSLLKADAVLVGVLKEYGEVRSANATANVVSLSLQMHETQTGKVVWAGSSTKGGVGWGARLLGSTGGDAVNDVTEEAVDDLVRQLFR